MKRDLARAARERCPFSIVMGDIAPCKRWNDVNGQQAGDEVLRAMGGLLQACACSSDIPCLYGGEEFTW